MKIQDLDLATRKVIACATIHAQRPDDIAVLDKLRRAIAESLPKLGK